MSSTLDYHKPGVKPLRLRSLVFWAVLPPVFLAVISGVVGWMISPRPEYLMKGSIQIGDSNSLPSDLNLAATSIQGSGYIASIAGKTQLSAYEIQTHLSILWSGATRKVGIGYTSHDPQQARKMVDAIIADLCQNGVGLKHEHAVPVSIPSNAFPKLNTAWKSAKALAIIGAVIGEFAAFLVTLTRILIHWDAQRRFKKNA